MSWRRVVETRTVTDVGRRNDLVRRLDSGLIWGLYALALVGVIVSVVSANAGDYDRASYELLWAGALLWAASQTQHLRRKAKARDGD
jgi:hypothetical protein